VLQAADREEVRARLQKFVERHVEALLGPLLKFEEAEGLEGMARGVAFRITEHFGVLPRDAVADEVKGLSQDDRAKLRAHGLRFGAFTLFMPALLKPAATDLRLLLWHLERTKTAPSEDGVPAAPANGLTSVLADATKPQGFYDVSGYRVCGARAVRVDMLERLSDLIRDRVFWKPRIESEQRPSGSVEGGGFTIVSDMMSLVGCSGEDFEKILLSLGFKSQKRNVPKPAAPVKMEAAADTAPAESTVAPVDKTSTDAPGSDMAGEGVTLEVAEAATGAPVGEVAPAADVEMIEVDVWWPKDTGPFRHQHKKHEHKRHDGASRQARDGHARDGHSRGDGEKRERRHDGPRSKGKKHHGDKPHFESRPPRKDKPMDPNSPFAALLALKEQMTGDKTGGKG
jgi:ATP-dependent RNA helicase SUPV3L1/SUV3